MFKLDEHYTAVDEERGAYLFRSRGFGKRGANWYYMNICEPGAVGPYTVRLTIRFRADSVAMALEIADAKLAKWLKLPIDSTI